NDPAQLTERQAMIQRHVSRARGQHAENDLNGFDCFWKADNNAISSDDAIVAQPVANGEHICPKLCVGDGGLVRADCRVLRAGTSVGENRFKQRLRSWGNSHFRPCSDCRWRAMMFNWISDVPEASSPPSASVSAAAKSVGSERHPLPASRRKQSSAHSTTAS